MPVIIFCLLVFDDKTLVGTELEQILYFELNAMFNIQKSSDDNMILHTAS